MSDPARASHLRLPADRGLPALGLIMQLQGGVFIAYGSYVLLTIVMATAGPGFGAGGEVAGLMLLAVVGIVRAALHFVAGQKLARRSPDLEKAVRAYIICALAFTILFHVVFAVMLDGGVPLGLLFGATALSLFWPLTLALLLYRPSVRGMFRAAETFDVTLVPADRSIVGAGVLMVALGAIGLVVALYVTVLMVTQEMLEGSGVLFFIVALAFVARSVVHIIAGMAALRGPTPQAFQSRTNGYMAAAVVTCVAVMIALFATGLRGNMFGLLITLVAVGGVLLTWPFILRTFAQEAVYADIDGDESTIRQGLAPDRGLTALGYLLIWQGTLGVAIWLFQLSLSAPLGGGGGLLPGVGALLEAPAAIDLILTPLLCAATLWAGIELIRVGSRHALATYVYAAATILATVLGQVLAEPTIEGLGMADFSGGPTTAMVLAISVVVPLLAIVLVRRANAAAALSAP